MRYYHPSIKNVGGVRKNVKKSKSELWRAKKWVTRKNSKFRFLNLLKGVPINVPMRYYHPSIKNVGGVRKNVKKSKSELWRAKKWVTRKNSKFRFLNLLKGVPMNVPMRYYHPTIKNVGGVRKNVKKCLKITSFSTVGWKREIIQPWNLCLYVAFTNMHQP